MKERREYWMEPDVRAVRGVYDEGRTEDGLIHLAEVIPGSIQITREELREWCMKHFTEDFSIECEINWAIDELFDKSKAAP